MPSVEEPTPVVAESPKNDNRPVIPIDTRPAIRSIKKTSDIPNINNIRARLTQSDSEEKPNDVVVVSHKVSIDDLKATWIDFAARLKKEGREREYNTLNQKVDFHEDLSIKLTLPNSFQAITIESLQQELLGYLRETLRNTSIQLITEVEKTENKKLIYTNSEKFEYLAQKYPQLRTLRSRLELDSDF